ncbi:hypothetical protein BBJ28_00012674 [Nothophytophthora sp. Chile5]|nr:hypothetical protein BBJ28_00012674 [Nothophytophthora sp. Chile5]
MLRRFFVFPRAPLPRSTTFWTPLGAKWRSSTGLRPFSSQREDNKTSILLEVEDGPGALQDTLKFFWKHDVNMTRIESRPSKGHNMNYSFYIDFDGKHGHAAVDELMADLKENCLDVMVLNDKKGL